MQKKENESYKKVKLYSLFSVTHVVSIFYRGLPQKRTVEKGLTSNSFWELFYVDRGDINIETDNGEITLSEGEGILYAPYSSHRLTGSTHDSTNVITLSFYSPKLDVEMFGNKVYTLNAFEKNVLSKIIKMGNMHFERFSNEHFGPKGIKLKSSVPGYAVPFVKASIEYLLLLLYIEKVAANIERKHYKIKLSQTTSQAIDYMYQNVYKKLTLDEIALFVNMSSTQFRMQFKREIGRSVIDYFNDIKIEQAKILIREDLYSLGEIALKLDYCSESYFSRQFKQKTGMTPSEYSRLVNLGLLPEENND